MENISKILSVIDPTVDDQPALRRAAWLAENCGAELELLVCYYNEYLSGDRLFDSPSLEKARSEVIANQEQHLEDLAEPIRKSGVVVTTTAAWITRSTKASFAAQLPAARTLSSRIPTITPLSRVRC